MSEPIVVSSPGKVLIAGGYLVLDPEYTGVVVSTSSRFYASIRDAAGSCGPSEIVVRSPQFIQAEWTYSVQFDPNHVRVEQTRVDSGNKNKFVHLALQYSLSLALEVKGAQYLKDCLAHGLDVAIAGGNDFYSQRAKLASLNLPRAISSLSEIPPFCETGVSLSQVHKTGLGSSAALITSLVSALLLRFGIVSVEDFLDDISEGRRLTLNTAQLVHCVAQGKVGSGFDVSAAVFGSHIYRRFDPAVLQPLMNDDAWQTKSLLPMLSPANSAWNYDIQPFQLPPLVRIMLADVDAGSDTPSLVGKVLKWRQQDRDQANKLWNTIHATNQSLANHLTTLSQLASGDPVRYERAVKYISTLQPMQWLADPSISPKDEPFIQAFFAVHEITQHIRGYMRDMGKLSDVPIEPPEQTRLLDACVSQAGVIGGGVPGAGGYDAIWLLVCDLPALPSIPMEQRPLHRVERVWSTFQGLDVSPLAATESKARGVRIERLDDVLGLRQVLCGQ